MLLFYTPDVRGDSYRLSREESRHIVRVLRLSPGDTIFLTDGMGNLFRGSLANADPNGCLVEVLEKNEGHCLRDFHLHVAIAPTKNINRFEWFLEKATEIGIEEITPLICEHSERKDLRTDRLERVMAAAMKQSLKTRLPHLNQVKKFEEFVSEIRQGYRFIAHLDPDSPVHLKEKYSRGSDVILLIGPEGDFSEKEIETAIRAGYEMVSLGQSRLRTETAGLVACSVIATLND